MKTSKVQTGSRNLLAAEEQMRQMQKLEAIGQLTGGVAHDSWARAPRWGSFKYTVSFTSPWQSGSGKCTGQGTTFYRATPRVQSQLSRRVGPPIGTGRPEGLVLVVNDNAEVREMTVSLLQDNGYRPAKRAPH